MSDKRISTFGEFWPFYLGEHSLPVTRTMHFIGSWIALLNVVAASVTLQPAFLLSALISGYAFAWISHFFMEKNRPATFTYPVWSFIADWKMWAFIMTGRINAELDRLGIRPKSASVERPALEPRGER